MLNENVENNSNSTAIVSQVANAHTPQDFTVSRLLSSTPNNLLGKFITSLFPSVFSIKNQKIATIKEQLTVQFEK